ncbi:transposase domain-containing protein, partial [Thiolapillus sp.]|uniref:transposase domain-containing protein n=1 Tax=Thiolapillus sp. TaxID=2017437 RepID=UPI0035A9A348
KANGVEPFAYLHHVLQHIGNARTVEDIEALLPWNTPVKKMGSSAEFVGSRGGFEANDQVCPVGVEHPTRSLRRWSCETIINSEGTKWDAAQDYPEPGAEIQVICLQVGALGW